MMHDLKNSVAQLQLLVANAARHAHNRSSSTTRSARSPTRRAHDAADRAAAGPRPCRRHARRSNSPRVARAAVAAQRSARAPAPVSMRGDDRAPSVQRRPGAADRRHRARDPQCAGRDAGSGSVAIDARGPNGGDAVASPSSMTARAWTPNSSASACSGRSTAPRAPRAWESAPTRCANMSRSLGGDVEVQSTPGKGTRFLSFRLAD